MSYLNSDLSQAAKDIIYNVSKHHVGIESSYYDVHEYFHNEESANVIDMLASYNVKLDGEPANPKDEFCVEAYLEARQFVMDQVHPQLATH